MKLRSVPIGAKFSTVNHLHCIKLPKMVLKGHPATFLVNVLWKGMTFPLTIADYFSEDAEVTLVE